MKEFKERVLHKEDDLFAIFFVNFISVRLAYLLKNVSWITPNQITYSRILLISPLIILFLLLAPLTEKIIFYGLALVFVYLFILSDWLDGQLARARKKPGDPYTKKGMFLDSVADRFSTILLFVMIFSIGLWLGYIFIIYSAIILFSLKTFHLMVITKLFYYEMEEAKGNRKVFATNYFLFLGKLNKILRIKKWHENLGGSDRIFLTIMLPLIFIIFGWEELVFWFMVAFIVILCFFFIHRIKNLILIKNDN